MLHSTVQAFEKFNSA